MRKGEDALCEEEASMNLAVYGLTHQQVTFTFWLAIAAFAVYLTIKRLQRIGAPDERPSFYVAELPEDPTRDPDEPVTIAWFGRAEFAEMWAANLRAEGIEANVSNATLGQRYPDPRGYTAGAYTSPAIVVRSADASRAIEILREANAKEHLADGQDVPGNPPDDDSDGPSEFRPYRS